jgi:hypothetical protein
MANEKPPAEPSKDEPTAADNARLLRHLRQQMAMGNLRYKSDEKNRKEQASDDSA